MQKITLCLHSYALCNFKCYAYKYQSFLPSNCVHMKLSLRFVDFLPCHNLKLSAQFNWRRSSLFNTLLYFLYFLQGLFFIFFLFMLINGGLGLGFSDAGVWGMLCGAVWVIRWGSLYKHERITIRKKWCPLFTFIPVTSWLMATTTPSFTVFEWRF